MRHDQRASTKSLTTLIDARRGPLYIARPPCRPLPGRAQGTQEEILGHSPNRTMHPAAADGGRPGAPAAAPAQVLLPAGPSRWHAARSLAGRCPRHSCSRRLRRAPRSAGSRAAVVRAAAGRGAGPRGGRPHRRILLFFPRSRRGRTAGRHRAARVGVSRAARRPCSTAATRPSGARCRGRTCSAFTSTIRTAGCSRRTATRTGTPSRGGWRRERGPRGPSVPSHAAASWRLPPRPRRACCGGGGPQGMAARLLMIGDQGAAAGFDRRRQFGRRRERALERVWDSANERAARTVRFGLLPALFELGRVQR